MLTISPDIALIAPGVATVDFERFLEDYCLAALRLVSGDAAPLEPDDRELVAEVLVSTYRRVGSGPVGGRSGVIAVIRQECARLKEGKGDEITGKRTGRPGKQARGGSGS